MKKLIIASVLAIASFGASAESFTSTLACEGVGTVTFNRDPADHIGIIVGLTPYMQPMDSAVVPAQGGGTMTVHMAKDARGDVAVIAFTDPQIMAGQVDLILKDGVIHHCQVLTSNTY